MRSTRLLSLLVFVASFAVAACGGGDDGPGTTPDAPPVTPDAPTALTGLGQKCGAGLPACPATAPECFGIQGTNGNMFCSPKCVTGGTAVGGNGVLTMIQPAPNNACMTSYTGSVGMGMCAVILAFTPMETPVQGKNYTGVEIGCAVVCGAGNACPTGLAAMTLGQACVCIPQ
jgi:hypothetical protein